MLLLSEVCPHTAAADADKTGRWITVGRRYVWERGGAPEHLQQPLAVVDHLVWSHEGVAIETHSVAFDAEISTHLQIEAHLCESMQFTPHIHAYKVSGCTYDRLPSLVIQDWHIMPMSLGERLIIGA
jgi:hypothetical protein